MFDLNLTCNIFTRLNSCEQVNNYVYIDHSDDNVIEGDALNISCKQPSSDITNAFRTSEDTSEATESNPHDSGMTLRLVKETIYLFLYVGFYKMIYM